MKCTRCGNEIPKGYVYCNVCGKEVRFVPDYNYLEDDMLSSIIQEGAKETVPLQKQESTRKISHKKEAVKGRKSRRKKVIYICSIVCVLIAGVVLTVFLVQADIQKKHDNSFEYQYEMAEKYLNEKDYENAMGHLNRALELKPFDRKTLYQIIDVDLVTGKRQEAITILKDLLKENPKDKESCQKLIDVYAQNREYGEIRELCEEVKSSEMLELFEDYLVDQPSFSRISGTYTNAQSITITSEKGYKIYYTTNGSDPTKDGIVYHNAIPLKEGTTVISAVTQNAEGIYSEVVKATYTIKYEAPKMPSVTPGSGTYGEPQMITVHVPADCVAYYTWDGSTPTEASAVYTQPMEMPPGNNVLSVLLINSVGLKSNVYRVNYVYMPQ